MSFQPNSLAGATGGTSISYATALSGLPRIIVRTTDSASRASTTTLTDDSVLIFPIAINEVWRIDAYIKFLPANATMDAQFAFSQPAGCAADWGSVGAYPTEIASWSGMGTTGSPLGLIGAGSSASAMPAGSGGLALTGIFVNAGTAGNIGFQWCQNTSDAGALFVARGSHLMGWRLE